MEDGIPRGLQHCHKMCCKKGGHCGRQACMVQRQYHYRDVVFWTGRLVYDINTRELKRELCTGQSTLYTKTSWSVLTTSSLL